KVAGSRFADREDRVAPERTRADVDGRPRAGRRQPTARAGRRRGLAARAVPGDARRDIPRSDFPFGGQRMKLVNAEVPKLARRRGTMIWCALLTIGSVLVANIVLVSLHAANAARHGPAGGAENLRHVMFLLGGLGGVAAILIGSAAGTQDAASGVFRE